MCWYIQAIKWGNMYHN